MRTLVMPGSFDPVTLGHLAVIADAARVCDRLVVAVALNPAKGGLFEPARRAELIRASLAEATTAPGAGAIEVVVWNGLVVRLCARVKAVALVKGLRSAADLPGEAAQAQVNRDLGGIPTLWLPAPAALSHVSSTIVREVAAAGGDLATLVPPPVARALSEKFAACSPPKPVPAQPALANQGEPQ